MPGNKFYNGILFGISEALAMIVSNLLMLYLYDMTAYRIVFVTGILSYLMILFEDMFNPLFAYTATVLLVVSIGGLININLLIMELRVPPKNIAAVQLMTRTIATGFGVLAPIISSQPTPIPYIVLMSISTLGFLASTRLPVPGHHLPKI